MSDLIPGLFLKALLASVLIGGICSTIGVFVVTRRLSFLGDGLAHAAFGGIALGIFLHLDPLLVALPFTVIVALVIAYTHHRTRLSADTAIGTFFALSIAVGVLLIHLARATGVDIHSFLFGDVTAVSRRDLITSASVTAIAATGLIAFWPRLAYATFDPDLAEISGVPVRALEYLLFVLVAIVVVVGMRVVGILLVASFLVIPAATARMVASTLVGVTGVSVVLGVSSGIAGLIASYALDIPSGATMVIFQGTAFMIALAMGRR